MIMSCKTITAQEILLRKRFKFQIRGSELGSSKSAVLAFNKNIETLGFTFSPALIARLEQLSINEIEVLYQEIVPILRKMVGARKYNPMYPNFPKQVMEASDEELYINAIVHYFSAYAKDCGIIDFTLLPKYKEEARLPLFERTKLRVLNEAFPNELDDIFNTIISSNSSITEEDKEYVEWFIINDYKIIVNIPQKEQLALVIGLYKQFNKDLNELTSCLRTATDVLRTAVIMSGGDVSLAKPTKFRKFSRRERKFFLAALENANNITEDMLRYKERWKCLGFLIHPEDYKDKFPKTYQAFDVLRNNLPFSTFNGKVEKLIKTGDTKNAGILLASRPGEFARRLDSLLRKTDEPGVIINQFAAATGNGHISTPVLLQVKAHFSHRRSGPNVLRTFFPKGNVAKIQAVQNNIEEIDNQYLKDIIDIVDYDLENRFKQLPSLGNVYLDENLKNYNIPFAQRSTSKALKTIARGSRIPFEEDKNIIRFFIHWRNKSDGRNTRVDIDSSAIFYDSTFRELGTVAWYDRGLKNKDYAAHSGDITDAPKGASEFIDVDINKALQHKVRYVMHEIHCYNHPNFLEIPECFAGWMLRENAQAGKIFEARTVQNRFDITSELPVCIPLIIDIKNKEVIWADIAFKGSGYSNDARFTSNCNAVLLQSILNLVKPTVYDLLEIHTKARGKRVDKLEEADTVFSVDIASDQKLLSEYLV